MKYIPLAGKRGEGKFTMVDDEDFAKLSASKWQVTGKRASSIQGWGPQEKRTVVLARMVLGSVPPNMQVDHINGDPFDNRKCNLRVCTQQQNQYNRKKRVNSASGYKGVYALRGRWTALLKYNGKTLYLGMFDSDIEAAKAYNAKAAESFGQFARLNAV